MTSDRSAKKAARARMAATGESYSAARRGARTGPGRPAEMADPPAIDPREHAIQSSYWGAAACHLVRYQDRYYGWITRPGAQPRVYPMKDEETGRHFADTWQAQNLLHTGWDELIAHIFLFDPASEARIIYHAAVLDVAGSGIWFACLDDTADGESIVALGRFGGLGEALGEFAGARRAGRRPGGTRAGDRFAGPGVPADACRQRFPVLRGCRTSRLLIRASGWGFASPAWPDRAAFTSMSTGGHVWLGRWSAGIRCRAKPPRHSPPSPKRPLPARRRRRCRLERQPQSPKIRSPGRSPGRCPGASPTSTSRCYPSTASSSAPPSTARS